VGERIPALMTPAREAMREAFDQHYLALLRLCVLLSGSRELAEDLVQEAFVRAAQKIQYLPPDEVRPYLRRAAVNLWKKRLRRIVLETRHRGDRSVSRVQALSLEDRDALWRAVIRLPDRQRACLVLRYFEDMSERAVAETLGCSVGTVKSHTSRALTRLRKEVTDEH
jgi:RNA polymerase sigma-70 factor (sigma-E family)